MTGPATEAGPLLVATGLRKEFEHVEQGRFGRRREHFVAVDDVSLTIAAGETLGLVGESGSGKSTIGRMILGLTRPTAGTVRFDSQDITRRTDAQRRALTRDIQVVFQDPYASLDPRQRIADIIREPLDIHRVGTPAERAERVREVMKRVALPDRMARFYPHQLSGGLRQRVCIATALVVEPRLIVADEPVSALDVSVQSQILDLFDEVRETSSVGLLFISHDLSVVPQVSDRVAVLRRGKLLETGPAEQLFASPRHPYTKALLSAVPPADPSAPFEPSFYHEEEAEAV
jgi:ABC-type glutathione transport system ATPase component